MPAPLRRLSLSPSLLYFDSPLSTSCIICDILFVHEVSLRKSCLVSLKLYLVTFGVSEQFIMLFFPP